MQRSADDPSPDRLEEELFRGWEWRSSLRVPVKDRRGFPLALVVAVSAEYWTFTMDEAAAVALLARRASARLENRYVQQVRRRILASVRNCKSIRDVYGELLRAALDLTRASRGEIAFYDWDRKNFVYGPSECPPGRPPSTPGAVVPTRSLLRKVWTSRPTH